MDPTVELADADATGWQRGLYDDIKQTFRSPIVNWVFRALVANAPSFSRYLWAQVKPTFTTAAFGRFEADYRDKILSVIENRFELPVYDAQVLGHSPASYERLRGELAAFDIVGPRLAVLFSMVDRSLHGRPVGDDTSLDQYDTAPLADYNRDPVHPPTLAPANDVPESLRETVADVRSVFGFDDSLPSIFRCLLTWPSFFERVWTDLRPTLATKATTVALRDVVDRMVDQFVGSIPYPPALTPDALAAAGFEQTLLADITALFDRFTSGGVRTVLPSLHIFAATVSAAGPRE